jgi:hypothetical protein
MAKKPAPRKKPTPKKDPHLEKAAAEVPLGGPLAGTPSPPDAPAPPDTSGEIPSRGVNQQKLLEKYLELAETPGLSPENRKTLLEAAHSIQNHDVETEGTAHLDLLAEQVKDGLPPDMRPAAKGPEEKPVEPKKTPKPAPKPKAKSGSGKVTPEKLEKETPAPAPAPAPGPKSPTAPKPEGKGDSPPAPAPAPEPAPKPTEPAPKPPAKPPVGKVNEKLKLLRAGNIGKAGLGALAALLLYRSMKPEQDTRQTEQQMEEARVQSRSAKIAKAMEDMRMQRSLQQNQMRLAQANPTLYTSVMAGRRVPTNSVSVGGTTPYGSDARTSGVYGQWTLCTTRPTVRFDGINQCRPPLLLSTTPTTSRF